MRYLEDFQPGDVHHLGTVTVRTEDIVRFGTEFDPQPFHVEPDLAARSSFGTLVASGWHTAAMFMRLYVDGLLRDSACEGSPGVDQLRFFRPVRSGDVLSGRVTILGSRPAPGQPDRGIVQPRCELLGADGAVVFSMILHSIFRRRPSCDGPAKTPSAGVAAGGA